MAREVEPVRPRPANPEEQTEKIMVARIHSTGRCQPKPTEGFLSQLLDPIDRLTETIYSVLILLTFTLAFRIFHLETAETVPAEYVTDLFTGALLATVTWGVIDGIVGGLLAAIAIPFGG